MVTCCTKQEACVSLAILQPLLLSFGVWVHVAVSQGLRCELFLCLFIVHISAWFTSPEKAEAVGCPVSHCANSLYLCFLVCIIPKYFRTVLNALCVIGPLVLGHRT